MTRAGVVAWHEFASNARRPSFLFAALLAPLGAMLAWGLLFALALPATKEIESTGKPVGVVDTTSSLVPVPESFSKKYVAFADEAEGRAALLRGELAVLIATHADFPRTGGVDAWLRDDLTLFGARKLPEIGAFVRYGMLAREVEPAVLERALDPKLGRDVEPTYLDGDGRPVAEDPGRAARELGPGALSFLLVTTIFLGTGYLLQSVAEEKEIRVLDVVLSSVTASDLLWGKVLGRGAITLTLVSAWSLYLVVPAVLVLGRELLAAFQPAPLLLCLGFFAIAFLQFSVLLAAAGAIGSTHKESQSVGALLGLPAGLGPMIALPYVLIDPNHAFLRVASVLPLVGPMTMLVRVPTGEVGALDVVGSFGVQAATVPVLVWGASRVFRAGLLSYGSRLTWRQIARILLDRGAS